MYDINADGGGVVGLHSCCRTCGHRSTETGSNLLRVTDGKRQGGDSNTGDQTLGVGSMLCSLVTLEE